MDIINLIDTWKRDYIRQCWEYVYNGTDYSQVVRKMIEAHFKTEREERQMNTVPSYNYSMGQSKAVDVRHDEEITALKERCTALETRCTQLESRCTALESLTATHTSEIAELERRVAALEV